MYSKKQYEHDLEMCDYQDSLITRGIAQGQLDGLVALTLYAKIEACRRTFKGKLLGARSILLDNDKKPACDDLKNHRQVCMCGNYNKFKAQEELI